MRVPGNLPIDDPAFPLLQAEISYLGITSANGAATGLTVACADLANEPSYTGHQIKLLSGPAAGQCRTILIDAAGIVTVDDAFRDNTGAAITVVAGTRFVIGGKVGGGGGPVPPTGPSQGLSFMGDVTTYTNPTTFASTDLAGFGDFAFLGTYLIYVFRDAAGAAPQGEFRVVTGYAAATGTFTHEAFSAPLAVGDKVMLVHISVLFPQIVARGTFTFSSATVPADAGRTEADNWFNGCILMPLLGNDAFQPKQIVDFANAGGVFTVDPNNPFTAVTGNVWYLILKDSAAFVPAIDAAINRTPSDVIGGKEDTAVFTPDLVSSAMRYLKGLMAKANRQLFSMDFWSDLKEEVAVTGAQSTIALSPVTIADLPNGATIVRAIAMFKFRMVENTYAGVNKLDATAALPIQVDDGAASGYVTAIDFVDDAFTLAASTREGGDVIIGDNDIAARVDGNDTYPVRWLNAKADQNNIQFNDVQCGLRIWYSV